MRQGFDNAKYIELQAAHIKERISQFGGKLYLEFGGKLFDDYHASRVLPGFEPDSKFRMLKSIAHDVEVIIAINANHIEKNKARGDLGITYDEDVLPGPASLWTRLALSFASARRSSRTSRSWWTTATANLWSAWSPPTWAPTW